MASQRQSRLAWMFSTERSLNPDKKVDWPSYVDTMAALHGLTLDAGRRDEVVRQMAHIETLARRFVDFPLAAEVELAPVFRP